MKQSAGSSETGIRKPPARTRVTNGSATLPNTDGRTLIAKRYRDISSAIISDQGGVARLSEARLQLVRRFSAAAVVAEQMEARLANGQEINIAEHAQLTSTMIRVAQRIGLGRRAKDITPTLAQYLQTKAEEEDDNRSAD